MLKASKLKALLLKVMEMEKQQTAFINSVPSEIRSVFFDNPYVDGLHKQINFLLEHTLENLSDDVCYFLYDDRPFIVHFKTDKIEKEFNIHTVDDYISYLIEIGAIKDDLADPSDVF